MHEMNYSHFVYSYFTISSGISKNSLTTSSLLKRSLNKIGIRTNIVDMIDTPTKIVIVRKVLPFPEVKL